MNLTLPALLAVGGGGALGALLRYLVGGLFLERFGPSFPYGTLFINVSGSFLIGVVIQLELARAPGATPLVRLLLATGVLGGYTTFSAFSYEIVALLTKNALGAAALYAVGSVVIGLVACLAGVALARLAYP